MESLLLCVFLGLLSGKVICNMTEIYCQQCNRKKIEIIIVVL
jgi:hypothetical protein